jgi:hypothetical protein
VLGGRPSWSAFAPTVIVVIPRSGLECNSLRGESEWLPRQCPACQRMTVIGNGRRLRSAYDRDHDKILVRRGRCRVCGRTVTVLPARCVPAASYSLIARQESLRRIGDGMSVEQAAPDCRDPDRIADPSTLRRWCWRRMESLAFALYRVATLFAWDWRAAARILIPEPDPP